MQNLYLGDTVNWKGSFGKEPAKEASIVAITFKDKDVDSIDLDLINPKEVFITLNNGFWAYGYQIQKV